MSSRLRSALSFAVARVSIFEQLETRQLLSASVGKDLIWTIKADRGDNAITVQADPADENTLQVYVDGKLIDTVDAKAIEGIEIEGRAGNDTINIDLGEDYDYLDSTLIGGAGDDSLSGGSGEDDVLGGWGEDVIDGGLGDDDVWGGIGDDELIGAGGEDELHGQSGDDILAGGMGDDEIFGGGDDDQLSGGYDDDMIDGNDGEDVIRGGDGVDSLDGGQGPDVIFREKQDYWKYNKYDKTKNDQRINPLKKLDNQDQLKQWLIDAAVQQWQFSFDQPYWPWWHGWENGNVYLAGMPMARAVDLVGDSASIVTGALNSTGAPAEGLTNAADSFDPSSYSQTNTNEKNVDEADLVKTDGQYLYIVQNNELVIVDAWPAADAHIVSRTAMDENSWISGIYLNGDKVTIVSNSWVQEKRTDWLPPDEVAILNHETGEESGGDGSDKLGIATDLIAPVGRFGFWGGWDLYIGQNRVEITELDVTDRSAPKVITTSSFDGNIADTREIGTKLYLVINNSFQAPHPKVLTVENPAEDGAPLIYESEAAYRQRLEAMPLLDLLPQSQTTAINDDGSTTTSSAPLIDASNLYVPTADRDVNNMFSVVLMDVSDSAPGADAATSVVGFTGTIYASTDSLYVTAQHWDAPLGDYWAGDLQTDIYRFSLANSSISFEGVGEVPGWTINSYAMSEYDGKFRIATTSEEDGQSNNIFVLEDTGDALDIVGGITGLAYSERIYSTRFVGDRAYVVTFRQTDPLFAIDLSDAANPTVAGVLEMPGYSSYLHPVGNDLLIGLGRDADEKGRVKGLKVSLFNVSDIHNPTLVDTYVFKDRYSDDRSEDWWFGGVSSAAEWDPHAFSYFPEQKVLAVPVLDWGWWHGSAHLEMLKVDAQSGFSFLGTIEQKDQVLRSVQIDNFVYSIGSYDLAVVSFDNPDTVVSNIKISNSEPPVWDDIIENPVGILSVID